LRAGRKRNKKLALPLAGQENLLTFASRFGRKRRKNEERVSGKKKLKKLYQNACRKKKSSYLCIPFRKEAAKRLKEEKPSRKKKINFSKTLAD